MILFGIAAVAGVVLGNSTGRRPAWPGGSPGGNARHLRGRAPADPQYNRVRALYTSMMTDGARFDAAPSHAHSGGSHGNGGSGGGDGGGD
ncbi:MAG: hypothetical protein IT535_04150 [Bauldia sp.]|nr:hypothetical protein [Bauldia sp.]